MDVNFGLLSERLRRLLSGEEGTLLDAAKEQIQNLQTEIEIVTSLLRDHVNSFTWILLVNQAGQDFGCSEILAIMKEINNFARESEKFIDTFISGIMHEKNESNSKRQSDAFLGLQSKIIDIKQRMHQVQTKCAKINDVIKPIQTRATDGWSSSGFEERNKVGLEDKMEELLDLLIDGQGQPQLSVVALVDSNGSEKTALAAEAYNSNYVKNYFDCCAWVSTDIKFKTMLDSIIKSVMPPSALSEIMDKDNELKITTLHDYLKDKKYLIVLDDVWMHDSWDKFRKALPDHHNGSRVLMSIADINILSSCRLKNGEKIQLDSVPAGGPLRATYEGWPFVVLYYGSKSLKENMNDMVCDPFEFLFFSASSLSSYLKLCCLYLPVFPERSEISTRQLYQLWIAEGFIPDNSEATAEEYLKKLIEGGFVQVKKRGLGGTIKICYIPSIAFVTTREIAQLTEFVIIDVEGESKENFKRISILGNPTKYVTSEHAESYLHSLVCLTSGHHHLGPLDCENICKKFKFLRLLDLGYLVLNQYPAEIENLFLLRYLKLNIPSLKSLPSSLGNLQNLYTLDMPSSYIDDTPDDIWKMHKLRHLNFGYIKLPAHPGKYCSSMENLNFISALHVSSCTPDILSRLPNLQSLRIYGNLSSHQYVLSESLCKLVNLEFLKLENESKMSQSQLSQMVLAEYQFPPRLTHLSLSNTELKDDPMPTLEQLPHLQVLKLKHNSYFGRKLVCHSGGFPCLKILHLKSMLWLEEWTAETEAMPKLESLVVNPCAYLRRLPEELWRIKSFYKLELQWPQPELRRRLQEFEDMERYDIQIYPYGF